MFIFAFLCSFSFSGRIYCHDRIGCWWHSSIPRRYLRSCWYVLYVHCVLTLHFVPKFFNFFIMWFILNKMFWDLVSITWWCCYYRGLLIDEDILTHIDLITFKQFVISIIVITVIVYSNAYDNYNKNNYDNV